MKQKLFLTITMLMAMCSFCNAREAYAVYDPVEKTLTFYYDNNKWQNPSCYTYVVNPFSETPDCLDAGRIDQVLFNYTFIDEAMPQDIIQSESWYTIDGMKLSGKSTKKGVFVNNGRKVVVK